MTRTEMLREQADTLRRAAEASDIPVVRAEVLRLAALCERQLADIRGGQTRKENGIVALTIWQAMIEA